MSFLSDLRTFQDDTWDMVSLYKNGPCDNMHLFTASAINLAERLGENPTALRDSARVYASQCMPVMGLLHRKPEDAGAVSFDELIGASSSSSWSAGEILEYGLKNKFCYNVENPGKFEWRFFMARNISFVPFLYMRAYGDLGIAGQLSWSVGLLFSLFTPKDNTSGKLLMDVQIPHMRVKTLTGLAVRFWEWRMGKIYKGRSELYFIYFGFHPLSVWQRGDFN